MRAPRISIRSQTPGFRRPAAPPDEPVPVPVPAHTYKVTRLQVDSSGAVRLSGVLPTAGQAKLKTGYGEYTLTRSGSRWIGKLGGNVTAQKELVSTTPYFMYTDGKPGWKHIAIPLQAIVAHTQALSG